MVACRLVRLQSKGGRTALAVGPVGCAAPPACRNAFVTGGRLPHCSRCNAHPQYGWAVILRQFVGVFCWTLSGACAPPTWVCFPPPPTLLSVMPCVAHAWPSWLLMGFLPSPGSSAGGQSRMHGINALWHHTLDRLTSMCRQRRRMAKYAVHMPALGMCGGRMVAGRVTWNKLRLQYVA